MLKLSSPEPMTYMLIEAGHITCKPPFMKSPISRCCITATKQGTVRFLYNEYIGIKRMQNNTTEWRGSRCSKPGINMLMSGKTDARNNSERLMLTLNVLDSIFPVKYPKANFPTEYIKCVLKQRGVYLLLLPNSNDTVFRLVILIITLNSLTLYR